MSKCRITGAGGSHQVVSYWQNSEFLSCGVLETV